MMSNFTSGGIRIRTYPHFDAKITAAEAQLIVADPVAVGKHAFFPFIERTERWTKYAEKGSAGKEKSRPLRRAARLDACIYSYYRSVLVDKYEAELQKRGIGESVLAYRRIPCVNGKGNKSNIHFANDVFRRIEALGDCLVYSLDIKSFFDSLDHAALNTAWKRLMSMNKLPLDHHKVFKSVTRYAWINEVVLYKALGIIGPMKKASGRSSIGYLKSVPLQVCSTTIFRKQINPLLQVNDGSHGIPQGSPMSDVLANLYLLEFDAKIAEQVNACGGSYYRYSDDILIIIPEVTEDHQARIDEVQKLMYDCGEKLTIHPDKTCVHRFTDAKSTPVTHPRFTLVYGKGAQGKNGLEYLGFRYDGTRVYLRDSTLSNLNRKAVSSAKRLARRHCDKHPGVSLVSLRSTFNYNLLIQRFGKVKDFESKCLEYRSWTFWTYARRAKAIFGDKGDTILLQLKKFKRLVSRKADEALAAHAH